MIRISWQRAVEVALNSYFQCARQAGLVFLGVDSQGYHLRPGLAYPPTVGGWAIAMAGIRTLLSH